MKKVMLIASVLFMLVSVIACKTRPSADEGKCRATIYNKTGGSVNMYDATVDGKDVFEMMGAGTINEENPLDLPDDPENKIGPIMLPAGKFYARWQFCASLHDCIVTKTEMMFFEGKNYEIHFTNTLPYYYELYEGGNPAGGGDPEYLDAPSNLTASDGLENYITVEWQAVDQAQTYSIYRSNSINGPYDLLAENRPDTTYNDNVSSGAYYFYKVKAVAGKTESEYSAFDSGYTGGQPPVPPAPLNLQASDGTTEDSMIRVTWDSVDAATSYNVYRSTTKTGTYEFKANVEATTWDDYGSDSNKFYYYKVKSLNNTGESDDFSNIDSGYFGNSIAIAPPTNVAASDGELDFVTITWKPAVGADHYAVFRSESVDGTFTMIADMIDGTSFNDPATPGIHFYYHVKTYAGNIASNPSAIDEGFRKNPKCEVTIYNKSGGSINLYEATVNGQDIFEMMGAGTINEEHPLGLPEDPSVAIGPINLPAGTFIARWQFCDSGGSCVVATATMTFKDAEVYDVYFTGTAPYYISYEGGNQNGHDPASLDTPMNLIASDGLDNSIHISWQAVDQARTYSVYRSISESGPFALLVDNVTDAAYDDHAAAGTYYYYKVKAIAGTTQSAFSAIDSGYVGANLPPVPAAPSNLLASDGTQEDMIQLTWDGVEDANGYNVYRATAKAGSYMLLAWNINATTYDDVPALANVFYYYKVKSLNPTGESADFSNYDSGYHGNAISLAPPVNVIASDGAVNAVAITWNLVTGADHYAVFRSPSVNGTFEKIADNIDGNSYNDPAAVGVHFYYYVKTYSGPIESNPSGIDEGFVGVPLPEKPMYVTASDETYEDHVEITWDASNGADYYKVFRASEPGNVYELISPDDDSLTVTTYEDNTAQIGAMYYYKVRAYNISGFSEYSDSDTGSVSAPIFSDVPQNVQATDGLFDNKITITWDAAVGSQTAYYKVYRSDSMDGSYTLVSPDDSSLIDTVYDDATVAPGLTYFYQVMAFNSFGASGGMSAADSGYASQLTLEAPAHVQASDGQPNAVTITWDQVSGAIYYAVFRSASADGTFDKIADNISGNSYTDPAAAGATFYYYVKAYAGAHESNPSTIDAGSRAADATCEATIYNKSGGSINLYAATVNGQDIFSMFGAGEVDEQHPLTLPDDPNVAVGPIPLPAGTFYARWQFCDSGGSCIVTSATMTFKANEIYDVYFTGTSPYYISYEGGDPNGHDPANLDAPMNVSASDGLVDIIRVSWQAVEQARTYSVYRSESDSGPFTLLADNITGVTYDDTVSAGKTYYYQLKAIAGATESVFSAVDSGYTLPPAPTVPADITASDGVSASHVVISWTASTWGAYYKVFRASSPDDEYVLISANDNSLTGTIFTDTTASIGTVYFYKVKAYNASGESDFSDYDTGYTGVQTVPDAPQNVQATDGEFMDKIAVTWDDAGLSQSDYFKVYRADSFDGSYSLVSPDDNTLTDANFDDTNVVKGRTYYYKVIAFNSLGSSDLSAYDSGYALLPLPDAPMNVTASDETPSTHVEISWSASAWAAYYQVFRASSPSGPYNLISANDNSLTGTTYNDTNVEVGAVYYYAVKAFNASGESDLSDFDKGSAGVKIIPDVPYNVQATDGLYNNKITITWDGAIGAGSEYFKVYRSDAPDGSYTLISPDDNSLTTTAFDDMTVVSGVTYYYKVRAFIATGPGDYSMYDSGYAFLPVPAAPANVMASDVTPSTHVVVSWNVSAWAAYYKVFRSSSSDGAYTLISPDNTSLTGTTFNDTNTSQGVSYYYKVKAYNASGASDYSNYDAGSAGAIPVPVTPLNVQATDGSFNNKVTITWIATVNAQTQYFKVYRADASNGTYALISPDNDSLTATTYSDTNVLAGKTYYYKVRGFNSFGPGGYSSYDSGYAVLPVPAVPANITASDVTPATHVAVSWTASTWAAYYQVYRSTAPTGTYTLISPNDASVTGTSYNDSAVTIGMLYYYKVKACNASGASNFSNYDAGQAGTQPIPDTPDNVQASDGTSDVKVTVTWNAAAGAETYSLYKSVVDGAADVLVAASIVGTTYDVTSINPGRYYFKVKAFNWVGESDLSLSDGGYRGITDNEFFELYDQTTRRMDEKVNLESSSDERCDGDTGGSFFKDVQIAGFGANVYMNYTNYSDFFSARRKLSILNSTTFYVKANISGNGTKTGRVNISGVYSGYVDHNFTVSNKAVSAGTFTVKQNSKTAATTLQWDYKYNLNKYAFLKDANEK